jgi:hypothetical protein
MGRKTQVGAGLLRSEDPISTAEVTDRWILAGPRRRYGRGHGMWGVAGAVAATVGHYSNRVLFHNSQPHPVAANASTRESADIQVKFIANVGT